MSRELDWTSVGVAIITVIVVVIVVVVVVVATLPTVVSSVSVLTRGRGFIVIIVTTTIVLVIALFRVGIVVRARIEVEYGLLLAIGKLFSLSTIVTISSGCKWRVGVPIPPKETSVTYTDEPFFVMPSWAASNEMEEKL